MLALNETLVRHALAATVEFDPFPHVFLPKVFPDEVYVKLREFLPGDDAYRSTSEHGDVSTGSYAARSVYDFDAPHKEKMPEQQIQFLNAIRDAVLNEAFIRAFMLKFDAQIKARFGNNYKLQISAWTALVRDQVSYSIGPHTDVPNRLISLLIYLPQDDSLRELGTSLYVPKIEGFTCEGEVHHQSKDFDLVKTAPFLPNTAIAFPVSNISFHGIEVINRPGLKRDLLLVNVTWRKDS